MGKANGWGLANVDIEQAIAYLARFHGPQSRLYPQIFPSTCNQTLACFLSTCWVFHIVFSLCSKLSRSVITPLPLSRVLPLNSFHGDWLKSGPGNWGNLACQWPQRECMAKDPRVMKESLRVIRWVTKTGRDLFLKQGGGTLETKSG